MNLILFVDKIMHSCLTSSHATIVYFDMNNFFAFFVATIISRVLSNFFTSLVVALYSLPSHFLIFFLLFNCICNFGKLSF